MYIRVLWYLWDLSIYWNLWIIWIMSLFWNLWIFWNLSFYWNLVIFGTSEYSGSCYHHCIHAYLLVLSFGRILGTGHEGRWGGKAGWGGRRRPVLRANCPTCPWRRGGRAWRPSKYHKGGWRDKRGDGGETEGWVVDTVYPSDWGGHDGQLHIGPIHSCLLSLQLILLGFFCKEEVWKGSHMDWIFSVLPYKLDLIQTLVDEKKFERAVIWTEFWHGRDEELDREIPIFKQEKYNLMKKIFCSRRS